MIFLLSLLLVLPLFAQSKKQLIVNINFGVAEISKKVLNQTDATVINISSIKEFEKFKTKDLSRYDEIFYQLHTHGSEKVPGIKDHELYLKNDETLGVTNIIEHVRKSVNAGKKVGLLDFSCYGGTDFSAVVDLDPKLFCLVSGDSTGTPANARFEVIFMENLAKKIKEQPNLEELYLEARSSVDRPNAVPGISTNEGLKLISQLGILQLLTSAPDNGLLFERLIDAHECSPNAKTEDQFLADQAPLMLNALAESNHLTEVNDYKNALAELKMYLNQERATYSKAREVFASNPNIFPTLEAFTLYGRAASGPDTEKIYKSYLKLSGAKRSNIDTYDILHTFDISKLSDAQKEQLINSGLANELKRLTEFKQLYKTLSANKVNMPNLGADYGTSYSSEKGRKLDELTDLERSLYSKIYDKNKVSKDHACKTLRYRGHKVIKVPEED